MRGSCCDPESTRMFTCSQGPTAEHTPATMRAALMKPICCEGIAEAGRPVAAITRLGAGPGAGTGTTTGRASDVGMPDKSTSSKNDAAALAPWRCCIKSSRCARSRAARSARTNDPGTVTRRRTLMLANDTSRAAPPGTTPTTESNTASVVGDTRRATTGWGDRDRTDASTGPRGTRRKREDAQDNEELEGGICSRGGEEVN